MSLTRTTLQSAIEPKRFTITKPTEIEAPRELGETMKDLWDEEIVKGASFVLDTDWTAKVGGGVRKFVNKAVESVRST